MGLLDQHKEGCMCDKCIQRRVIENVLKREQEKLAEEYLARRGEPLPRSSARKD